MHHLSPEDREAARALLAHFHLPPRRHRRRDGSDQRESLALLVPRFAGLPYENISKILQREIHGDTGFRLPSVVVEDHLRHGLGGTCFSLTFLLQKILTAMGIPSRRVMGHMSWGPNTHCALLADTPGGSFLLDPGYAVDALVSLPSSGTTLAPTAYGELELAARSDEVGERMIDVFTRRRGERRWRYTFAPRDTDPECFFRHWQASFSGPSLSRICVYRATSEGHLYLRSRHLRLTSFSRVERAQVGDDLPRLVESRFGIDRRRAEEALDILSRRGGGGSPPAGDRG